MNLVNLEAAVKTYGTRVLLDQVSLGVSAGDRIGVVGRNGSGKTTLLSVLAGAEGLTSGRATRARDLRVGYLPQSEAISGPVRDIVFSGQAEHEWAGDARTRALLSELLAGIGGDSAAERLSGGERRRVALAALLLADHDLLLLDEPTNHLDIEAIGWLAGYLGSQGKAFVIVTHDRWLLDTVCERTWEVADGQVHAYDGGYSAYVLARAERERLAGARDERRRNLLRKELAWLRRGPPARTSKPRFRMEAAAALIADEPAPRATVELASLAAARLGKTVIDLNEVTVEVGDRRLLESVTWQLGPGDRVGVVGVNGSGKTTLLSLLAGQLGDSALTVTGLVTTGKTVRVGYLRQDEHPAEPGLRALEAAQRIRQHVRIGKREFSASQLLDRLGLRGERQWTPIAELSGGERRRLALQMVLMAEPNVLLLDEPTNDLDIETLNELEDMLDGFPGPVVVVSHDRYFLERATDWILAVDGGLRHLPRGVEEYLALRERAANDSGADGGSRGAGGSRSAGGSRGAGSVSVAVPARSAGRPGAEPASGAASAAQRERQAKKELARLDRQIEKLADRESGLQRELAVAASDYARLAELGSQLQALQAERESLEDRWLTVAERLSG